MKKTKTFICNAVKKIVYFRWFIAFLLFICLVVSKIHFSSMGMFYDYFPTVLNEQQKKDYKLYGKNRAIRSDEWAVHTPKYLSQEYNNYEKYSKQGSIGPMNTILDYYQPSKDISLIGKPFNLGYILFGSEYGISFYFCMLEILLFMTAFEMFFILTNRKIIASTIGMLFIGFAPAMQWWLIPHITIVFVYAMGLFCLGYYFLTYKRIAQKIAVASVAVSAIIGFCLSIFPSCQIICALLVLALLACVIYRDKSLVIINKPTIAIGSATFLVSFLILFYIILDSKAEFAILFKTSYPGNRLWTGGNNRFEDLFTNLTSIFLPLKDVKFSNNSEISDFIHFAPIFLIIFHKVAARLKKEGDKQYYVGKALFFSLLIEIIFMCCGFSEILSKITLFRYVNRMHLCYGFTAVIFSVWFLNIVWTKKDIFTTKQILFYCALYGFLHLSVVNLILRQYYSLRWLAFEILLFGMILFLGFFGLKKMTACLVFGVMFSAGFKVNPICRGISPIKNHPISKFIEQKVQQNKDDLWISLGEGVSCLIGDFLMANGARTISTTHFYPDMQEWKLLNMDQKYYDAFNRYAHHNFFLTQDEERIEIVHPDNINIFILPNTLKKMGIKFIVVNKEYIKKSPFPSSFKVTEEFEQDSFKVLKLL